MKRPILALIASLCLTSTSVGQEEVDLAITARIKSEAFGNSQVMDHAFYLTDVHGPRLTGSPGFAAAAAWAEKRLTDYGLVNVLREPFEWGRGWVSERFSVELTAPQHAPLLGLPLPWSPSTDETVEDVPVHAPLPSYALWSEPSFQEYFNTYFKEYRGWLNGKIVLIEPNRPLEPAMQPLMHRFTAEELQRLEVHPVPGTAFTATPRTTVPFEERADQLMRFYKEEGVRLLVFKDFSDGGGVLVLSHALGSNWLHFQKYALPPPMIGLYAEHYDRIVRLLSRKLPVRLRAQVRTRVQDSVPTFSVTADIKGTNKSDELVMIGAHLDSWTLGTGATDNAAGVAVMMEVVRILKALKLEPRRTIRIALWGGHEGEGIGSRTYVRRHFGSQENPTPAYRQLSAYFNLDNGTGRIRGIYLEGNDEIRPIFEKWLEPFHSIEATTVSIRSMPGTDHMSFDRIGLPGFQFIQDPVDYARTHHTNIDLYDHLQETDLKQASAIIATFAYLAATREALLPRKRVR
jgi:carboxypeptidase Q